MVENFEKILAGSLHLEDHGISDMSASYLSAVREVFPNAKQTIDKFRVKQVLLKALDAVRIDAFVEMRHFIAGNAHLFERIERVELKHLTYQKETDENSSKSLALSMPIRSPAKRYSSTGKSTMPSACWRA